MRLAILLYGLFRNPDAARFWRLMLPPGDVFVFSVFTTTPLTKRSHDGPIQTRNVFPGVEMAKAWSVVDQASFDEEIQLKRHIKFRDDPWRSDNKTTLGNAIRVLHQLDRLRRLFLAHDDGSYTHALVSRVDLLFVRPVQSRVFLRDVVVPNYDFFPNGVNDRFLAGPLHRVLKLMQRLDIFNQTGKLAEPLMKAVIQFSGMPVLAREIGLTRRIRTNGWLEPAHYHTSEVCPIDTVRNMHEVINKSLYNSKCSPRRAVDLVVNSWKRYRFHVEHGRYFDRTQKI